MKQLDLICWCSFAHQQHSSNIIQHVNHRSHCLALTWTRSCIDCHDHSLILNPMNFYLSYVLHRPMIEVYYHRHHENFLHCRMFHVSTRADKRMADHTPNLRQTRQYCIRTISDSYSAFDWLDSCFIWTRRLTNSKK
jgi:hypothetical protein